MKILRLEASNFQRLKAVDITPKGHVVQITGKNANGKQQPVSEPVLTPQGWRRIGDIKVGDFVIGADGSPTRVKGVFPQTERRTFRLTMSDGGTTRCGPEHLWTVGTWSYSKTKKTSVWTTKTITTQEIIDNGIHRKAGSRRWALPNLGMVQFEDPGQNLPINPYELGVILGDGHIERTGYVTVTSVDAEILENLNARSAWRGEKKGVRSYGTAEWSRPLVHLGLAGRLAHDKFIPSVYKSAAVADRIALLAGLLDTDGTPSANWAEFATASSALAADVVDLARSLGYVVNVNIQTKKYTYKGEKKEGLPSNIVRIRRGPCPFALTRKVNKWKPSRREDAHRFIDRIEQVQDEDSVCIQVEAEDGLYVTNDFIVTHNTSVLDAIWAALGGAAHLHVKPIRNGATKAHIRLDLGDIIVTRSITEKGSTLTVENAEGMAYKSPQRMLDDLVGALSFDPLAFTRMKPKDQFDQVKTIAQLDVDVETLDGQNRRDFEARTVVNRDLKAAQVQLEALPAPAAVPETTDLSILLEQQRNLSQAHSDAQVSKAARSAKESALNRLRAEIEEIRATFNAKKEQILALESDLANGTEADESDIQELAAQIQAVNDEIQNIQKTNEAAVEARQRALARENLVARVKELEKKSEDLTEAMAARTKVKQDAIAKAKMPVPGLGFGEGMVLFNGVPFEQASSAEQLRVSVAIAIAGNPKLRVIRIQDGSLLDDTSMDLLAEMARENDMQCWVEAVSNNDSVGIVIEDGAVKVDNYADAPAMEFVPPVPVDIETMDALRRGEKPLLDLE